MLNDNEKKALKKEFWNNQKKIDSRSKKVSREDKIQLKRRNKEIFKLFGGVNFDKSRNI